jgi:hypothetical protein
LCILPSHKGPLGDLSTTINQSLITQRRIYFFIAAERATMKNHSAAEAAAGKAHAKQ